MQEVMILVLWQYTFLITGFFFRFKVVAQSWRLSESKLLRHGGEKSDLLLRGKAPRLGENKKELDNCEKSNLWQEKCGAISLWQKHSKLSQKTERLLSTRMARFRLRFVKLFKVAEEFCRHLIWRNMRYLKANRLYAFISVKPDLVRRSNQHRLCGSYYL